MGNIACKKIQQLETTIQEAMIELPDDHPVQETLQDGIAPGFWTIDDHRV